MLTLRPAVVVSKRPEGIAAITSVAIVASYSFWVLLTHYDAHHEEVASSFGIIFLCLTFAVFGIRLSNRMREDTRQRRAWMLLALAHLSWAAGECIWYYYETILHLNPVPSASDFFFILYWILIFLGVTSFPLAPIQKHEKSIFWLDLAIVMTTSFIFLWDLILTPTDFLNALDLNRLITILYPVGALLVFAATIALIQRDVEQIASRALSFLAIGMLCSISADICFAFFEIHQIEYSIVYMNILWMGALLLMIIAVALQSGSVIKEPSVDLPRETGSSRLLLRQALPYCAIVIAVVLLIFRVTSKTVSPFRLYGVLFGTASLVVLGSLRQHALLRENIMLYEEMQRLAITDALTGIYNRLFINQALGTEMARAKRFAQRMAILLIDVDGFKHYNDAYGHLQGDVALRKIAQILKSEVRSTDLLGRFGGDEFVAILAETDYEGALVVAEKMKKAVMSGTMGNGSLSVSAGIAIYRPGKTAEELLEEADRELYTRKKAPHQTASLAKNG
jgi:diguanylate cyclase (GGDEF)-like protein